MFWQNNQVRVDAVSLKFILVSFDHWRIHFRVKTVKIGYLVAFQSVLMVFSQIAYLHIQAGFDQKILHIVVTLENERLGVRQ